MPTAAAINNTAIAMLRYGDLDSSTALLGKALRSIKEQLDHAQTPTGSGTIKPEQEEHLNLLRCSMGDESISYSFFSQGFTTPEQFHKVDGLANASILSSIICFNLGVTYHIRGHKSSISKNLRKAQSLYGKSFAILSEVDLEVIASGEAILDLLEMALLNNLAQVSIELCQYKQCKHYVAELRNVALSIRSETYRVTHVSTFMDRMKGEFLWNAIILEEPMPAAAA